MFPTFAVSARQFLYGNPLTDDQRRAPAGVFLERITDLAQPSHEPITKTVTDFSTVYSRAISYIVQTKHFQLERATTTTEYDVLTLTSTVATDATGCSAPSVRASEETGLNWDSVAFVFVCVSVTAFLLGYWLSWSSSSEVASKSGETPPINPASLPYKIRTHPGYSSTAVATQTEPFWAVTEIKKFHTDQQDALNAQLREVPARPEYSSTSVATQTEPMYTFTEDQQLRIDQQTVMEALARAHRLKAARPERVLKTTKVKPGYSWRHRNKFSSPVFRARRFRKQSLLVNVVYHCARCELISLRAVNEAITRERDSVTAELKKEQFWSVQGRVITASREYE